jgi:phospholipid/cholesterol/gamma-HCH transport system ATP-binding protein
MVGLYEPMSGKILIDGEDIVTAEGEQHRAILRKIGVMYQSGALFGSMTLSERGFRSRNTQRSTKTP